MFDFLKKVRNVDRIVAPVSGKCIPIEEVPDSVFSSKMLGDGFAVIPTTDTVVAPVSGEITMLPESKHAFGMKTKTGLELLVHIGLDTVNLAGKGFTLLTCQGNTVKAGQPIVHIDRQFMNAQGMDLTTIVVFTGGLDGDISLPCYGKKVQAGDVLII